MDTGGWIVTLVCMCVRFYRFTNNGEAPSRRLTRAIRKRTSEPSGGSLQVVYKEAVGGRGE